MSERTLAEIVLGWTWERCDPANCHEATCGVWTAADGRYEYGWEGTPPDVDPTVDEILDWLQVKLPEVEPEWNSDGIASINPDGAGGWEVHWYCAAGIDGTRGDTLYAALEAAVRAVAGSSEEPT